MFRIQPITGKSLGLPKGTVCLTFDDGPGESAKEEAGPKTLLLAEYLAVEKVPATFFVTGQHAAAFPETITRLREFGHLVGNHTWNHPDLTAITQKEGDIVAELTRTGALLTPSTDGMPILFRPPYGTWSEAICQKLNADPQLVTSHFGPIMWDVDGKDWQHWQENHSPEVCAEDYMRRIDRHHTGVIVLQHDHTANNPGLAAKNRTYEMTKLLVPKLKERGYQFARLDELAELRALVEKLRH